MYYYFYLGSIDPEGQKLSQKLEQMLERLHFVLGGCVGEGTQDSDRIVTLTQNGQSLKEEGALAVVICTLCDAPSKFAHKVHPVFADGPHRFCRDWNKQVRLA